MSVEKNRAGEVSECKRASHTWMRDNFYEQWKSVWRSYFCEREPEKDDDGNIDATQTSIGMPGTHSYIERSVNRITAQIPNINFHAKDADVAKLIGRKLMLDWDRGGVQRWQKKHVRQATMFGWSVRAWYWADEQYARRKRVDPFNASPQDLAHICDQYLQMPVKQFMQAPPASQQIALMNLLRDHGRGNLLPVEYQYTAFHGAKSDFIFVGDCYPEPNFTTIQTSGYFIVERRRKREWIDRVARDVPELADGLNKFLAERPNGSPRNYYGQRQDACLREEMESLVDRTNENSETDSATPYQREWVFTEMWIPGVRPKLKLIGEEDFWVGEIDSPYDLDGKIPFTELVLIDDVLCGVGNSTARIMRGIQQLHDRQVNQRVDLVYNILRPLIGTSNWELYNNPNLVKKGKGFRIVKMRGPGDMWVQGEQAAMAAVATGLQDESGVMRLYQMLTGESNMSMASNVDPQQNRTATGARLTAYNQDVLVKGMNDMFTYTGLSADAEMMYLLNRSEMSEPVDFNVAQYDRQKRGETDSQWQTVEPLMFQVDGEIVVEAGSTLADDDESNVVKAQNLFSMFNGNPTVNQEQLRDTVLTAFGKTAELAKWAAPKNPPPPPEFRTSASIAVKWEMLGADEKRVFLSKMEGLPMPPPPPPGAGPGGPGGPPPGPPQMPPPPPQDPRLIGASAFDAASANGGSPFPEQVQQ
jgi:hypothetical protein